MTTTRYHRLAAHVRSLNDDDLNDLLVDLPRHRFTALVKVALAHPVVPARLELRLESAAPALGWLVLAGESAWPLGTVTRGHPNSKASQTGWQAWTRHGDPVAIGGLCWWRRRADAAGALAWVTPASGARCMVLAAFARALGDVELNDLLIELPVNRFDALLDAAIPTPDVAA
jgi:hypothetical protein